jgi:hypothetical protein
MEIYHQLRTWLDFHDPIFVILRAFFHRGESMVYLVTELAPCHAGIPPTVYLKARAGRARVDYDAKTAGIEPCVGCCWRWHGWVDGSWVTLRRIREMQLDQVRYAILTPTPMVQKTRVDGTSLHQSSSFLSNYF